MKFGGWKYLELSEEQRTKIGIVLPADWKFEGTPGEEIWPIFKCPYCHSECVRAFGGCKHICYIYDNESNAYDFLSDDFIHALSCRLRKDYEIEFTIKDKSAFKSPPWRIAEVDGTGIHVLSLFPELEVVEFLLPCGDVEWKESAAFLEDLTATQADLTSDPG